MTESERALVCLSAAISSRNEAAIADAIDAAHTSADGTQAEEVLLQSYLFMGFPTALSVLATWRQRTGRNVADTANEDCAGWRARGEMVCEEVYGGQYQRMRNHVAELHPDLERWMLEEGYGKVLGRSGLALRLRELCIIPLLVAQPAPRPLYSHLRGALNVGASNTDIEETLAIACAVVSAERAAAACDLWESVRQRRVES
jgi:4-carboxymuconolactone decarboxylase